MTDKKPKPLFVSELYKVVKRSAGLYAVTLASSDVVQFSGARDYCLSWAKENSGQGETE